MNPTGKMYLDQYVKGMKLKKGCRNFSKNDYSRSFKSDWKVFSQKH